jgi:protein phosphatase
VAPRVRRRDPAPGHAGAQEQAKRRPRRGVRFAKPIAALIATVVVLFLIGGAGYLASRQLYFVGTNAQGLVTIYRGFPYDLPAGIRLYETYYVSGVPAVVIPVARRKTLLNNRLRSETDAASLVMALEQGKIAK